MGIFDLPTIPNNQGGGNGIFDLPDTGNTKTSGIFSTGNSDAVNKAIASVPKNIVVTPTPNEQTFGQKYTSLMNNVSDKVAGAESSFLGGISKGFGDLVNLTGGNIARGLQSLAPNIFKGDFSNVTAPYEKASQVGTDISNDLGVSKGVQDFSKSTGEFVGKLPLFAVGGEATEATQIPKLLGGMLKEIPAVGKYLSPVVSNTIKNLGAFSSASQGTAAETNPQSQSPHWDQFVSDLGNSALFGIAGSIPKALYAVPATGIAAFASAKLGGASNGQALASSLLIAGMHAHGVLGDNKVDTPEEALAKSQQEARDLINKHSTIKIDENSSHADIDKAFKQASLKTHPDIPGGDTKTFQGVSWARDFLKSGSDKALADFKAESNPETAEPKDAMSIAKSITEVEKSGANPDLANEFGKIAMRVSSNRAVNPADKNNVISQGKNADVSDSSNVLADEARKYKSADEYVNTKPIAYHGGNISDIEDFDPLYKVGDSRNDPLSNIGLNLSDKNTAQFFADHKGGKVVEVHLTPNKIKKTTYNSLLHEIADVMEDKSGIQYGKQIRDLKTTDQKNEFLIDNISDPEIAQELSEKYREQGYDMIEYKNTLDGGTAYIPLTKQAISTKSQLTNIYNKAHGLDTNGKQIENKGYGNNSGGTLGSGKDSSGRGSDIRTRMAGMALRGDGEIQEGAFSNYDRNQSNNTSGSEEGQGKQLRAEKPVIINEETQAVLKQFGFSDEFTTKLTDVHAKGGVENIQLDTVINGREDVVAAYNITTNTLHINQNYINDSGVKDGSVINHEVDGHSWYSKLAPEERKTFYENLKNNKGLIKEAWEKSEGANHADYWRQTIEQIKAKIAKNSTWEIADDMAYFTGLMYNPTMSLDSFIDRSLNLDKIIVAVNNEMVRRGLTPIELKAQDTLAIMEHNAMIAENASNLPANDDSVITRYIADIQDGTLKFGEDSVKALAYPGETDLTLKTLEKLKGRTTVSKQFISDLTNSGDIKQTERDIIREILKTEGDKVNVKEFAGRYLKNNYGAKPVTDEQGVTWYEVPVTPQMAQEPVTAFRMKSTDIEQLRRMLDREQQSLDAAISNPEAHAMAYGENKIPIYQERIKDLKARIAAVKNPTFETGNTLEDARKTLAAAQKRTGVKPVQSLEPLSRINVTNSEVPLSEDLSIKDEQIIQSKEYLKDILKDHPGKILQQLIDKKEGEILDPKDITKYYHTDHAKYLRLKDQQDKKLNIAKKAFEGTKYTDMFDDPDVQREVLEDYQSKREELKKVYKEQKELNEKIKEYKNQQKDEIALNKIADRAGSLLDIKLGNEVDKKERAREKLRYIQAVEKHLKEKGRSRADSIKAITDFFHLTDSDRKGLIRINADFRTMTEPAFQNLLKQIQGKAYDMEQKRKAIMEIQATIEEKDLHKVENFQEAMKMKKLENMSIPELNRFNELLSGFQQGDTFLGKRTIQTANLTSLGDIKTVREAKTHLAKEAGVPITSIVPVQPTWIDAFTSDISLQNKNPLYKVMVQNTMDALTASGERIHAVEHIFQKLMMDARNSRKRGIVDRLIPTDDLIYRFNELDPADQVSLMKQMTPEEIRAAQFVDEYFEAARNYLMEIEALKKYVKYYIPRTHMGVLEYLKTNGKAVFSKEGFKGFVKEILDAEKIQKANFKIMDDKTGEVLPKQKFFKYSIEREGHLNPSKNVGKVFMDYVRTFEKMRELNQFVPKLDLYANLLTTEEKTQFGLVKNDTLNTFVKKWLNNKRGRIQNTGFGKGDFPDIAIRLAIGFSRLKDLGFNIPIALASNIGAQVSTYVGIGEKKYATGIIRMNTKQGKQILKDYEPMVGKTLKENLKDVSKTLGQKTVQTAMTFFSPADRAAKGTWLLGSLTPEEFKSGKISPERQTQIRLDMGRYHMSEGTTSIYGNTAIGGAGRQYKGWALPIINTTIRNIKDLTKMASGNSDEKVFESRSFKELLRVTIMSALVILLGYNEYEKLKKNQNRTFLENIAYNSYTEALSIIGAMDPTRLSTIRILGLLADLSINLSNIAVSLGTGDLAGAEKNTKQLYNKVIRPSFLGTPNQSDEDKVMTSITKSSSAARTSLNALDSSLADTGKSTWEQVKKLGVGTDEANALVSDLTDDEYTAYKYAKQADGSYWIDQAKTVAPIVDQAAKAGFGSEEANALIEDLTNDEYASYKAIKNAVYGKESTGQTKWDQQTFIEHVSNIAKGWRTDPVTAFDDLVHGDWKITQLKNGQIIVERMPLTASEAVKKAAAKNNANYKLDHVIPLTAGGTNRKDNLQIISTDEWANNTNIEDALGNALGNGKINGQQAREYAIRFKAGLDEVLTPELMNEYQNKYKSKPLTEEEIRDLIK